MTSKPASRSARAMTFAPRSWPSSPGFATTTRYGRIIEARVYARCRTRRLVGNARGPSRVCEHLDTDDDDERPGSDRPVPPGGGDRGELGAVGEPVAEGLFGEG